MTSEAALQILFREGELQYCLLLDPAAESATHSEAGQILDRDGPPRDPPMSLRISCRRVQGTIHEMSS